MYTNIHTYANIFICAYICIYIFIYICICICICIYQGPTFTFEQKWNLFHFKFKLTSQLEKLRLSSWLVTRALASCPSTNHMTSESLSSQLVNSTCKVKPLKSHSQAVSRTPNRSTVGGQTGLAKRKSQNRSLQFSVKTMFVNYFEMLISVETSQIFVG